MFFFPVNKKYQRQIQWISLLAFMVSASLMPMDVKADNNLTANLNFQGFTGLLNMPTARVLNYGDFQYNFSNQVEMNNPGSYLGGYKDYGGGHNNQLGVGVFPGVEFVGRNVTDTLDEGSDISGNLKIQIPYISNKTWAIALGIQDIGGSNKEYGGQYIVGSYSWKNLDVSFGAGSSSSVVGRMDGMFAGLDWAPIDWLSLMVEHDGGDQNVGLRMNTPRSWLGGRVQLSAMAQLYTTFDSPKFDDDFYSLSIKVPLYSSMPAYNKVNDNKKLSNHHKNISQFNRVDTKEGTNKKNDTLSEITKSSAAIITKKELISGEDNPKILSYLAEKMAKQGFEGIQVALRGEELYVRFESAVFNRHSIDGLGVAMGIIAENSPANAKNVHLVLVKWGVPVFLMEGQLEIYRKFLNDDALVDTGLTMTNSPWKNSNGLEWISAGRSPYFKPRWTIRPVLATTIGTEYGVLDYSLAWRNEIEVPMWAGGAIYTTYDTPGGNSWDFEDGEVFMNSRIKEGRKDLMLSQTFTLPFSIATQFMAGEYFSDQYHWDAVSNESHIDFDTSSSIFTGSHRFRTFLGDYKQQDSDQIKKVRLWGYRYYMDVINTSFDITQGDFFNDTGWMTEAKHYFGDTTLSVYIKNNDNAVRMFGIAVSMPLTARKDMSSRYWFQAKGPASWRYEMETRIGDDRNVLQYGITTTPRTVQSLKTTYYDYDRLNPAWVKHYSVRLREAYRRFKYNEGDWGSWKEDTSIDGLFK